MKIADSQFELSEISEILTATIKNPVYAEIEVKRRMIC